MDFNKLIDKTHFDYEQNETKAKQLEERILKVTGISKSYLPKRKYGKNYKGTDLGITVQSMVVKGGKALAAFLVFDLNYWKKKAEEEEAKEKYINEFKEKTEELRYKNEQAKLAREKNNFMESDP